ncbi:MAG: MerR family transcriptional regulator [Gemmatimonadota bacterium]
MAFRTGLSRSLLRAWERRYGAVTPTRSDGGRRLYSDADLAKLRLLRGAVEAGRSIGDIAHLSSGELEALVREDRGFRMADARPSTAAVGGQDTGETSSTADPTHGSRVIAALDRVRALEDSDLEHALEREAASQDPVGLIDGFLVPLLEGIGALWKEGNLSPAAERLASGVIASFLHRLIRTLQGPPGSPLMLLATPAGTRHEIGALLAGAAAAGKGWRVVALGADLPAEDIAGAALQREATAVALSVIHLPPGSRVLEEIFRLREFLPETIDLIVGGRGIRAAPDGAIGGAILLPPDLAAFRSYCESILPPTPRAEQDPDAPR